MPLRTATNKLGRLCMMLHNVQQVRWLSPDICTRFLLDPRITWSQQNERERDRERERERERMREKEKRKRILEERV